MCKVTDINDQSLNHCISEGNALRERPGWRFWGCFLGKTIRLLFLGCQPPVGRKALSWAWGGQNSPCLNTSQGRTKSFCSSDRTLFFGTRGFRAHTLHQPDQRENKQERRGSLGSSHCSAFGTKWAGWKGMIYPLTQTGTGWEPHLMQWGPPRACQNGKMLTMLMPFSSQKAIFSAQIEDEPSSASTALREDDALGLAQSAPA